MMRIGFIFEQGDSQWAQCCGEWMMITQNESMVTAMDMP